MQLDSTNKTILVFSDVHQEIDKVSTLLQKENYDIAVSLGDWFDSFSHNDHMDTIKTCSFLKKWMFAKNFYSCIGNHDIPYFYDNYHTICSGYNSDKDLAIRDLLHPQFADIRRQFKWYIWIDDYLCSHAGVHRYHFSPFMKDDKYGITKWLNEQIKIAEPILEQGGYHWLFAAGQGRGGRAVVGGIDWLCFDTEFEPVDGLKQIVGHTSHRTILAPVTFGGLDLTESENLDIDCHLNEYLLILNGKITIKKFSDL